MESPLQDMAVHKVHKDIKELAHQELEVHRDRLDLQAQLDIEVLKVLLVIEDIKEIQEHVDLQDIQELLDLKVLKD